MNTKNRNQADWNLELALAPVSSSENTVHEIVTELEYKMTNMAFGYEYALLALDETQAQSVECEKISEELDTLKNSYIEARDMLKMIDETRLAKFETRLLNEKTLVFKRDHTVH